jgi:16S rRNA (guanine527-N7)-methyltransferase
MPTSWLMQFERARVPATDTAIAALHRYLDLLLAVNETMNLTRITDREEAENLHIADSLTLLPHLPKGAVRVADIGSGGGLPGVPIAIARPEVSVTMIDSTQKKAAFLQRVAKELKLANVRVIAARSEQLRGHQFDIVTARALAAMDLLVQWCLPLVRPGGKLLAMKGPRGRDELPAAERSIRRYRGDPAIVHDAELPGRSHLIIEISRRGGVARSTG